MTISTYAKLDELTKVILIRDKGTFTDHYTDNGSHVYVYQLFDFFVEVEVAENDDITSITPYMRGFKQRDSQPAITFSTMDVTYQNFAYRDTKSFSI